MKGRDSEDGDDNPDLSVMSFKRHGSSVQADGSLLLTAPPKKRSITSLFGRRESTKVVLAGESRIPFMALYQVG